MCPCGRERTVWCPAHGDLVCLDCGCAACDKEECSDTCRQMVCEWCPEYDRQAALVDQFKRELDATDLRA